MDFIPDETTIKVNQIEVDEETLDMLSVLGMGDIPGLVKVDPVAAPIPPISFDSGEGLEGRF
ncbi:hypothetical protein DITRI_Ditri12bG0183000 [Diplodiscus trichospermus]